MFLPAGTSAQETLANGGRHTGTISPAGDIDTWTFSATAGQAFVLRVGATNFTPKIQVFAPDNAPVGEVVSPRSDTRDVVLALTAASAGNYTVLVSSTTPGLTGTYALYLAQAPGDVTVTEEDEGGPLQNGTLNPGTISLGDLDVWRFSAAAGDSLMLRMGTVGFTPWIRLYGPDGALVGEAVSPRTDTRDVVLSAQATNSGPYTAVISSTSANGTGTYTFHLAQAPAAFEVSTGDEGGELVNGANTPGTIVVGDLDLWSFTAAAGDSLMLRMGTDTFTPWMRLYGPAGTVVFDALSPRTDTRDIVVATTATNAGTYLLVASSTSGNLSGAYNLHLAKVPGTFIVSPDDQGGDLPNGANVAAEIERGDLDMWRFSANSGDTLRLRMGAPSFAPWIRLYGPNGELAAEAVSPRTDTRDVAVSLQATNAGTYTVVAGSTLASGAGDYTIQLAKVPGQFEVSPNDEGGELINGAATPGNIALGDLDLWSFTAEAGDNLMVRLGATNFPPTIQLFDPSGALVEEAVSPRADTRDVVIVAQATNSGTYTVVAGSTTANASGPYQIHLAQIPRPFIVSEGDEGGPLANGATNVATLRLGDLDLWSFVGTVGDSNVFRLSTTNFAPWMRLYGPDGVLIDEFVAPRSDTRSATLIHEITNSPGIYTVVISGAVANSSGTYAFKQSRWAPDLVVPADSEIDEGGTLSVSISAQDPDEPVKPLQFTLLSGPPGVEFALGGATNATITWATSEATGPVTNEFVATVTDIVSGRTFIRTNSFSVIVREINVAPQLTVPASQTIDELAPLAISATASDADLPPNPLTFSLLSPPEGMSINPASGAISWTPAEAQGPMNATVTVVVTDSSPFAANEKNLSTTNTFTVTVQEVNTPPQLSLPPEVSVNELDSLNLTALATDADLPPNALQFTFADVVPAGLAIDPASGAISWTPTEAQGPATNQVVVRVRDNGSPALESTAVMTIVVREVNAAPVLPVQEQRAVPELTTLTVTNTATDSDLPAQSLSYILTGPATAAISAAGVITWSPTEAEGPSTNTFTTVATDNGTPARSVTNTFTVIVNEVNDPPTLEPIENKSLHYGTLLSVQPVFADADLPANVLTFSLEESPENLTIDSATGAISWTPAQSQVGTFPVTVRVADDASPAGSATVTFNVTVTGEGATLAIQRIGGGLMQLTITGDTGYNYELQESVNLADWTTLLTFLLNVSPYTYVDPASATLPMRYYRLQLVE